ncbi:LacI family DNA-binding transcriptional regulator [Rubellimicrobium aerolatum]|uniref:LacI family DNA-binding transcriptional regulator n=1 Tax=Rubellimicrobium aerolatum TaxID=490979 RepID=A0ABW0S8S3_9RHOB|nr:LacI family DNA-binding transcriptional regulator [Rubellimicrobium aerolatum]MBP1804173.1 LacI family transcriptional regulator [Rubellimicrobium aerolatum]
MVRRATIDDLAEAAGVSISTIDRVLNGRAKVRPATAEKVLAAAEAIGFYATPVLRDRLGVGRPVRRLGVLLLQSNRTFYRLVAQALRDAAAADPGVALEVEHLDDLSPEAVAARMTEMGQRVEALAVVSAEHPRVTDAVERLAERGVRTVALISTLTAPSGVTYVGLDHRKVGRTAGWAFAHICRKPGRIGVLVGSPRYRNQEMNESGFRSYLREHASDFIVLEPIPTFEDKVVAREMTAQLLAREPDLAGLFVSGGGISGVLVALQEASRRDIVVVGYDRIEPTVNGLIDGALTLVIAHPLQRLASECLGALSECMEDPSRRPPDRLIPFDIITAENL